MLSKEECRKNFVYNCERIRYGRNLTQKEMADILAMSLAGYKKMITENQSIAGYAIYRLSCYSGYAMSTLLGDMNDEKDLLAKYRSMTPQQQRFLRAVIDFEHSFNTSENDNKQQLITMIVPNGELYDGMAYDSCDFQKIDIGRDTFRKYENSLLCAIKVTGNVYMPMYVKNDILLVGNDRFPRDNEIGIFLRDEMVYVRRVSMENGLTLMPINGIGRPIRLPEDMQGWNVFGYVIKKMR